MQNGIDDTFPLINCSCYAEHLEPLTAFFKCLFCSPLHGFQKWSRNDIQLQKWTSQMLMDYTSVKKKRNSSSLCQRAHGEMSSITPSECSTKDMFFSFTFVHFFLIFSFFIFNFTAKAQIQLCVYFGHPPRPPGKCQHLKMRLSGLVSIVCWNHGGTARAEAPRRGSRYVRACMMRTVGIYNFLLLSHHAAPCT